MLHDMLHRSFRFLSNVHHCKRWISQAHKYQRSINLFTNRALHTTGTPSVQANAQSNNPSNNQSNIDQSDSQSTTSPVDGSKRQLTNSLNQHSINPSSDQSIDQSSPLVDSFGRHHTYLRMSLTERCNLRCQYCMPEAGLSLTPNDSLLTATEISSLMERFVRYGVNKIRFTGGEPTVRKDMIDIVTAAGKLRVNQSNNQSPGLTTIGMTSNGLVLSRMIDRLIAAGLTHVNISLDTLNKDKFETITRRKGHDRVLKAIDDCLVRVEQWKSESATQQFSQSNNQSDMQTIDQSNNQPVDQTINQPINQPWIPGLHSVKVNCVIQRGVNDDELIDLVKWSLERDLEIRFIEYMPFDGNRWKNDQFLSYQEMLDKIQSHFTLVPGYPIINQSNNQSINKSINQSTNQSNNQSNRQSFHEHNEVSKVWHVPGAKSRIGFISSMSDHFCSSCNRLRITADGQLKVCLFDHREVSLRDALRGGVEEEDIDRVIKAAVMKKKASHAGRFNIAKSKNRPMITIGG